MSHFGVRGFEVDRKALVAEHFARRWSDGGDDDVAEAGAEVVDNAEFVRELEHVENLIGGGEHGHVDFAGRDTVDVFFEGVAIVGQRPVVDVDRFDRGAAGFQAGNEAAVGDAIFLQTHDEISDG